MNENLETMKSFFNEKIIFITGGTGFIGKYLIFKLLKSFNVKRIYVLIRVKRNVTTNERFKIFLNSKTFETIEKDILETKLSPITGNIDLDRFGLSDQDFHLIVNNVNIVINSGASVRYNDTFKNAAMSNVFSTLTMIKLCREIKNLSSFIHVSTISVYADKRILKEKFYTKPVNANEFMNDVNELSEEKLQCKYGYLLEKYLATYMLTKTIAEDLLAEQANDLPVVIMRPSVVMPAYKHPFPGWFQGLQIGTMMMSVGTSGILQALPKFSNDILSVIPIDLLGNSIIAAIWYHSVNENARNFPYIYNCTTNTMNSPTGNEQIAMLGKIATENPSIKQLRAPLMKVPTVENYYSYKLTQFVQHKLFAHCADLFLRLSGQKAIFVDLMRKLNIQLDILIKTKEFDRHFDTDNYDHLSKVIAAEDKDEFQTDLYEFNWREHAYHSYMSYRRKILKESDDQIPDAVKRMRRMALMQKIIKYSLSITLFTGIVFINKNKLSQLYASSIKI